MNRAFIALVLCCCAANQPRVRSKDDPSNPEAPSGVLPLERALSPSPAAPARFSCPMHPDIQGPKGSACARCGMALTVPVEAKR